MTLLLVHVFFWAGRGVWAPALLLAASVGGRKIQGFDIWIICAWVWSRNIIVLTRGRGTDKNSPDKLGTLATVWGGAKGLYCVPSLNTSSRSSHCHAHQQLRMTMLTKMSGSPPPKIQRFQPSQWTTGLQEKKQDDGDEIGGNGFLRSSLFLIFRQQKSFNTTIYQKLG